MRPASRSPSTVLERAARGDGVRAARSTAATGPTPSRRSCSSFNPDPDEVAPPGTSLHRNGTELDLGPPRGLRLAGAQRRPLSLHPALPARSHGTTATRSTRARPRAPAAGDGHAPAQRGAGLRTRPASRRCWPAPRSAGTSRRRCSPPRSTPRATSTPSRKSGRCPGDRAVHARLLPGDEVWPTRSRPALRSTPRRT